MRRQNCRATSHLPEFMRKNCLIYSVTFYQVSRVVQPLNIVNSRKGTSSFYGGCSVAELGWLFISRFLLSPGTETVFPSFPCSQVWPCDCFWPMECECGGVLLCFHVRLGPCDPLCLVQPSWQSHRGKEAGPLHHFMEDSYPSIRNTHFELPGKKT